MKRLCSSLFALLVIGASATVAALGETSHRLINRQGIRSVEHRLPDLGFADGAGTLLQSSDGRQMTIERWIELGGEREDDAFRYVQHFHDPLKSWDIAGLDLGLRRFSSSIRWMQDRDQGGLLAANWSWHDARRLYYDALTEPDPVRREAMWADLFRALGQIMHLVVDASVPEHARNDVHLLGAVKLQNSYERWVGDQHRAGVASELEFLSKYLSAPVGFGAEILHQAAPGGERLAMVPVARLIDADRYDGSNPQVTVNPSDPRAPAPAGLAEIANANFFSESTLRRQYPHPTDTGLVPVALPTPAGRVRRYFARPPGLGLLPASPLRAECAADAYHLLGYLREPAPYPCVDAAVWREAATHMLPRAVGYARGVLEYFFRGSLRVRKVYLRAGGTFIDIQNLGDEELEGVFDLFARPGSGTSGERRAKSGAVNHGAPASIAPGATVSLPVTLLSSGHPTAAQLLVFRGRLGLEQEAVAGQVFTVPHVVAVQTGYTAEMLESCDSNATQENRHLQSCGWRPAPHIIDGELITDRTVPVVVRVSTTSPLAGRPSLELDGVPVAGSIWRRQGDEPDPRRFRMTFSGNPHGLTLTVELVNGIVVSTPMVTLIMAIASADKSYTIPGFGLPTWEPPWIVQASRSAHLRATVNPSYRALSVSRFPNPTNVVVDRFSLPAFREETIVRTTASEASYVQEWVDYLHVYTTAPPGGPLLLLPTLRAEFDALAFGPPPVVPWEADMERIYAPGQLEMLKMFVTAVPPPQRVTLAGRRRAGT